ncbi:MAG: AAA family ATPase [Spirochaetaceae bacterium]|nr:AAA family ATPase [Spirochaetaceae bacterium]
MCPPICPDCSAQNRENAKFCRLCGTRLPLQNSLIETKPLETQSQVTNNNSVVKVESENALTKKAVLDFIGLEEIRSRLQMFINTLTIRQKQKQIGMSVKDSTNILIFRGETGTGKSLVAEYFISCLKKSGCLVSDKVARTTAHKFQRQYQTDSQISKYLLEQNLGVFLIDEVHIDQNYLYELLLGLTEEKSETVCILLGLKENLEEFFQDKSELADLVSFYDFPTINDKNLSKILENKLLKSGFNFSKEVQSLFLSCVQEAKHRSTVHYKNGWLVEKDILVTILERQASRLSKKSFISEQDLKQIEIEDLPVTKKTETVEDILAMLNELIGMEVVKKSVADLCQSILNNQKRKALGLTAENPKIHLVLTGNPGTGKTTVARILGKLFHTMQLLPSDKVIETAGLDMTAGYVGQTKDKVNELCDKAMGGVLFIDEAYYLAGTDGSSNSFGSEAVGTLLKRMEDDRGKFVVIAAGYQNEMQNFLRINPGLDSRFEHKIHIEDYSSDELFKILLLQLKKSQFVFSTDDKAELVAKNAIQELCKNKQKDFSNARAIRNLFETIKLRMDSRISTLPPESLTKESLTTICATDIPHNENKKTTEKEVFAELNELIGMVKVKKAIQELYNTIKINLELKKIGQNPKKPEIHIALTGNPGTGKTTLARILGKLFASIGLLSSDKVLECDRSKIVAKYVGHTAQNMQRLCEDATGGILFIDEVYTLAKDDFGQEASDTLMKRMEDDRGKFVVVVAGYENKMNEWMSTNQGLSSRFTHHIHIDDYNVGELYELFCLYAKKEQLTLTKEASDIAEQFIQQIWQNRSTDFANGRTIRKFFDAVVRKKNSRVIALQEKERTKDILTTITSEDFLFEEGELSL